jgi:hypothetical protein
MLRASLILAVVGTAVAVAVAFKGVNPAVALMVCGGGAIFLGASAITAFNLPGNYGAGVDFQRNMGIDPVDDHRERFNFAKVLGLAGVVLLCEAAATQAVMSAV